MHLFYLGEFIYGHLRTDAKIRTVKNSDCLIIEAQALTCKQLKIGENSNRLKFVLTENWTTYSS